MDYIVNCDCLVFFPVNTSSFTFTGGIMFHFREWASQVDFGRSAFYVEGEDWDLSGFFEFFISAGKGRPDLWSCLFLANLPSAMQYQ
jgi:hypothetical protein